MRAAGYDVRVIADEFESWEENPPSLPAFIVRDLRWCQGNMQYLKLVGRPGFRPMGRFQLINAIMMYLGGPLWLLMLAAGLGLALVRTGDVVSASPFPTALSFGLYFGMLGIGFAPRLLGVLDILLRPRQWARYGGALRLIAGSLADALFTLLIGPAMMIAQARFVFGLALGRRVTWEAQKREGQRVSLREAWRGLWPQMVFGLLLAGTLAIVNPGSLPWAAPTLAACLFAVPFTCATAGARSSRWMVRHRLCAIPDEYDEAAILRRLAALTRTAPNSGHLIPQLKQSIPTISRD